MAGTAALRPPYCGPLRGALSFPAGAQASTLQAQIRGPGGPPSHHTVYPNEEHHEMNDFCPETPMSELLEANGGSLHDALLMAENALKGSIALAAVELADIDDDFAEDLALKTIFYAAQAVRILRAHRLDLEGARGF